MSSAGRLLRGGRWARLPRRTVRLRLTMLYGALFLLSGAALLGTTYFLVDAATGNAFIAHGKNGLTFAGFQIGAAPLGPKGGALSISSSQPDAVRQRPYWLRQRRCRDAAPATRRFRACPPRRKRGPPKRRRLPPS